MKNLKGLSFVTLMVIIAVCSLILRIMVKQAISLNISQNESSASATLKLIATALENYAKNNHGLFPLNFSSLTQANPVYLDKDYIAQSPVKGYIYSCLRLEPSGYNCSAAPATCNLTGGKNFTVTTGALFTSEECSKKEL